MQPKTRSVTFALLVLSIIEGLIVVLAISSIPSDPKNAFFLGFSRSRIVLLLISIFSLVIHVLLLLRKKWLDKLIAGIIGSTKLLRWANWIAFLSFLLFWVTVGVPPDQLGTLSAVFTRLKPVLIWAELIGIQVPIAIHFIKGNLNFKLLRDQLRAGKRTIYIFFGLFVITIITYAALALFSGDIIGMQLYFSPGAPLSPLQVILTFILCFPLMLIQPHKSRRKLFASGLKIFVFVLVFISAFTLWNSIPFPCTNDRPGPYPPNDRCYPDINDAVYSIGSHYTRLGEGINNHWLTDKPLYLVFLAFCQSLASPVIDDYLTVQTVMLALFPALLFLVGTKLGGYAPGLFLALLTIIQGANSIALYRQVGGVNVKLENPEILTALLLILLLIVFFLWMRSPTQKKWAALSGGILALACLVRFNAVLIIPVLVISIALLSIKNLKRVIPPILIFILSFVLLFGPWLISARDNSGNSFYWVKIQDVFRQRFGVDLKPGNPVNTNLEQNFQPTAAVLQPSPQELQPITQEETNDLEEPELFYRLEEIQKAGMPGVFNHFMNNMFLGFTKLPTRLSFVSVSKQVQDPMWDLQLNQPIWKINLSTETFFALLINLVLVVLGLLTAWKRLGPAGLSGIIILISYHMGNALAQTSGGRYLEPVGWILSIYYAIGIFSIVFFLLRNFSKWDITRLDNWGLVNSEMEFDRGATRNNGSKIILIWLGAALVTGLVFPLVNNLPSRLSEESNPSVEETAYSILHENGLMDSAKWQQFLSNSNGLVIQGQAYHPKYYRSSFYQPGNLNLELMVLAKDHVYVSYLSKSEVPEVFPDGGNVIIVGCKIGVDNLWGADRVISRTIAVIQLEGDQDVLFDPRGIEICSN